MLHVTIRHAVASQNRKVPGSNLTRPRLGTQPCCEAPGEKAMINIGRVRLPPR